MRFQYLIFLMQCLLAASYSIKDSNGLKDKYLISSLPGLYSNIPEKDIPLMFGGQLELYKENNSHLFFWKFKDNNILPQYEKRTIFWLNGGPGCSSMDGALMEIGPFRVNEKGEVTWNNGTWHQAGDIVFVDQPAGTGFSYTDEYDHDLNQVVWQFLTFMDKYYEIFPEERDNQIYFAGESYAGQYIPYIADGILKRNKLLKKGEKPYNLKGLLIGNGWIEPSEQSLSYLPYSMAAGIVDNKNPEWGALLRQHEKCQNTINSVSGDKLDDYNAVSDVCEAILTKILSVTLDTNAPHDQQCFNMYDYTLKDSYPSCGMNWPPDLNYVKPFLNSEKVQHDINLVLFKKWHECSGKVGRFFKAKNSVPSVKLLPDILKEIPIVLFNGNRDIICNYIGTENFIKKMEWNGHVGFENDSPYDWIYDNEKAGYIKTERNLTYVNVFDSSHMVPFDKPLVARSLIDILDRNYDLKSVENEDKTTNSTIITYPLGVRKEGGADKAKPIETDTKVSGSFIQYATSGPLEPPGDESDSDSDSESDSDDEGGDKSKGDGKEHGKEESSLNKITRIIQFVVLVILIWGVYMLYNAYKSRPSSIIKSRPSGRKKNVQWADQLRQFQEEDEEAQQQGFFTKTFNKFKNLGSRGYTPVNENEYLDEIEMGDNLEQRASEVNDFIIDSDEEEHTGEDIQTPGNQEGNDHITQENDKSSNHHKTST